MAEKARFPMQRPLRADSVEKLENRGGFKNLANVGCWRIQLLQGPVEWIRVPAVVFVVIDVVPRIEATEAHQRR